MFDAAWPVCRARFYASYTDDREPAARPHHCLSWSEPKALDYGFQDFRETAFQIHTIGRIQSQISAVNLKYPCSAAGGLIAFEFIKYFLDPFELR